MSLRFCTVLCAGAAALFVVAGCGTTCNVACAGAGALVDTRLFSALVVSAMADAPCAVNQGLLELQYGGKDQEVSVTVSGSSPGSCRIHATLADGSTWVAVLSWAFGDNGPCCSNNTYNVGSPPVFTRADGGTS